MSAGVVIGRDGLDELVKVLLARGFRAVGPVVADGAITLGEIEGAADLPEGWHDTQAPGHYSLTQTGLGRLFDWAVGPQSVKAEVFPPRTTIWRAAPPEYQVEEIADTAPAVAVIGARPCDLAALEVLGRVLDGGPVQDPTYHRRRRAAFLVTVECTRPASTCFCAAMGTGPGAAQGFDIALTEIEGGAPAGNPPSQNDAPQYLARAGTQVGRDVLLALPQRPANEEDRSQRVALLARAGSRMGRSVDTSGLPELLARNLGNRRWDEVAERCLACGNCTSVCPTCFCANFEDTTDLRGTVERRRTWASCSDLAHSYVHGGPVRASIKSRYRQWATHKFSWWWDQFGVSGCVGCGRCITWCPAGIDITEEIAALRASDGAGEP
ncbi:MAG: 4Fe-4S dicluster domain-containing protein [Acidimicrobiales bacterium]